MWEAFTSDITHHVDGRDIGERIKMLRKSGLEV